MSIKVCPVCCSDLCRGARGGRCEDLDTAVLGSDDFSDPVRKVRPRKAKRPSLPDMAMWNDGDYEK